MRTDCSRSAAERLVDLRLELAGGEELLGDVGAADQLALDEDLRDRRPLAEGRQLLPDPRVGEHVDGGDRRARLPQRLQRAHRVAARRRLGRSLDEDGDRLGVDDLLDLVVQRAHAVPFVRMRSSWMVPSASGAASAALTSLCCWISGNPLNAPRDDRDLEVVAAAGAVLDVDLAAGEGLVEKIADHVRCHRQ